MSPIPSNFPTSNDVFAAPSAPSTTVLSSGGDSTRNHPQNHQDLGDAVVAVQASVPLLSHDHSGSGSRITNKLSQVNTHQSPDTDSTTSALHHTLGSGANQSAPGDHVILSVNSLSGLATYPDKIVILSTDNVMYKFNNAISAWIPVLVLGPPSTTTPPTTPGYAEYIITTTPQVVSSGVATPIAFSTSVAGSPDITASGAGNTIFTLNRAGQWDIVSTLRLAATSTGIAGVILTTNEATPFIRGSVYAAAPAQTDYCVTMKHYFSTSGIQIQSLAFQTSGSSKNIDTASQVVTRTSISFNWVGP